MTKKSRIKATRTKPLFNTKQKAILQALNKSRYGLTPYDIHKRTGVSWVTVKKHLKHLERKQIVRCPRLINSRKKICRLNFDLIYGRKPLRKKRR